MRVMVLLLMFSSCNSKDESGGNPGGADFELGAPLEGGQDGEQPGSDILQDAQGPAPFDADPTDSPVGYADVALDVGSDDCIQVHHKDVAVYPGDMQAPSTGRPCLCYPRGTACYLYGDESTPPLLGPDPSQECPADEVCSGWMTDAETMGGYCVKQCFHPSAGTKNSGLGCDPSQYCRLKLFHYSETQMFKVGVCADIPDPVVDYSQCPTEPYCKPGTPDCSE